MLGERIKKLRQQKKLTQGQLGEKVNVTKVSISGYENGNRTPDTETLQKLADVLETSTDYLLGRTEDSSPSNVDKLRELDLKEDEEIHFFDLEGLTEEDIEFIKQQIEFLRKKARQQRKDTDE